MLNIKTIDLKLIAFLNHWFLPLARLAIFIVYFYFGILKLLGESPASPLARALSEQTIGLAHFNATFNILAVLECIIGVLFLIPKLTRVVIPLLFLHLLIVSSPLVLVPHLAWAHPFVPTLEGQYIIKNLVIAALAIGIAAQTRPLVKKSR